VPRGREWGRARVAAEGKDQVAMTKKLQLKIRAASSDLLCQIGRDLQVLGSAKKRVNGLEGIETHIRQERRACPPSKESIW